MAGKAVTIGPQFAGLEEINISRENKDKILYDKLRGKIDD